MRPFERAQKYTASRAAGEGEIVPRLARRRIRENANILR
jgi:hypothetical protein